MNLVDAYVTKVIGEPYQDYGMWWIRVQYDSWGRISETKLMFETIEGADNVEIGYKFLT